MYIEHLSCCGLTRTTSACWQIQSFGRPAEPAFVMFPTWRSGWYQTVAFAFILFDRLEVCSIQLRQSEYIMSWSNQFFGQQEGGGGMMDHSQSVTEFIAQQEFILRAGYRWAICAPFPSLQQVWSMDGYYKGRRVLEYRTMGDFTKGQNFVQHLLPHPWAGTGHVVYNGSLYYNKHQSNILVRDWVTISNSWCWWLTVE